MRLNSCGGISLLLWWMLLDGTDPAGGGRANAAQVSNANQVSSEHYSLEWEYAEAQGATLLWVAEELHSYLSQEFGVGKREEGRLGIRIVGTKGEFDRIVRSRGEGTLDKDVVGFCFRQDSQVLVLAKGDDYEVRRAVIHELVHQFLNVRVFPQATVPAWCREGYAEWVAMHVMASDKVRFGECNGIVRYAPGVRLLDGMRDEGPRASEIIMGEEPMSYGPYWLLMWFLQASERGQSGDREWVKGILCGQDSQDRRNEWSQLEWRAFDERFAEFSRNCEARWGVMSGEWVEVDGVVRGHSKDFALLSRLGAGVLKGDRFTIRPQSGVSGVLLDGGTSRGMTSVGVRPDGVTSVCELNAGKWRVLKRGRIDGGCSEVSLDVERSDDGWIVSLGGLEMLRVPESGRYVGVFVSEGAGVFEVE